jgi:hypothetical protein
MNRRHFISATALAYASTAAAGEKDALPKSSYYRIVMVDPRLITKTNDTYAVGYEKKRSDVMGSVYLSHAESLKLKAILSTALTSSDNVPFCGHAPAYVIVQMDGGKSVSFVSVCGLCKTWCGATGDLRVLDDAQLMPFLTKALPLPSAFSKVQELPHLFDLDSKKSFLELSAQL